MKTSLNKSAKTYLLLMNVVALLLLGYLFYITDWAAVNWYSSLLFLFLTFLAASFSVELPNKVVVSVSFAITLATILLFQPLIVVFISVLGDTLALRKGRNLLQYLFNASQLTLTCGLASLAFRLSGPGEFSFSLSYLVSILFPLLLCYILNSFFMTFIIALTRHERLTGVWLTNIKRIVPGIVSMAPLGLLIAYIYLNIGVWGLVLFFIPMLVARQSFISYLNMRQTFLATIQSLSAAIDAKDPYTKDHSLRVANYSTALARELGWSENDIELLEYVALIHDLGKVAVQDTILKKEGKLTEDEYTQMKKHSLAGFNIIKDVKFLAWSTLIIKHHHERWDGTGYPDGLKGEQIPEGARILAVADAFDAMTSDRLYRKSMGVPVALQEIRRCAGIQFDPHIAEVFVRLAPRLSLDEKKTESFEVAYGQMIAAETEN